MPNKKLNNTVDNKKTDWVGYICMKAIDIIFNREAGWSKKLEKEVEEALNKAIKQREEEINNDLLKIADEGEYEDLRREVEYYFKD